MVPLAQPVTTPLIQSFWFILVLSGKTFRDSKMLFEERQQLIQIKDLLSYKISS